MLILIVLSLEMRYYNIYNAFLKFYYKFFFKKKTMEMDQ